MRVALLTLLLAAGPAAAAKAFAARVEQAAADPAGGPRPWEQLCHALLTANEFAFLP